MKVYISADIEGVATATTWDHTTIARPGYDLAAAQMTAEVLAACEGAIAAGADSILVKDAHETGTNIDPRELPECAELIRGWSGHYNSMAEGITPEFDAAMFIGYHSAAGRAGNPLSHTFTPATVWVRLNGVKCSEFRLYSWACALQGVPSVLLSGDRMLCEDSAQIHPMLKTVAVKDGFGGMTRSLQPALACRRIRAAAGEALRQDLRGALCTLPKHFTLEICYKELSVAARCANYPGFSQTDDNTIRMETDDFTDVLRAAQFVM